MRHLLAAAALLAVTAAPALPATADDPLGVCALVPPNDATDLGCALLDPRYAGYVVEYCSEVDVHQPDGAYTFLFQGASIYAPDATDIWSYCWNEAVPQWKAVQAVPGPASAMVIPQRFPGMPAPGERVCTQFRLTLAAGNRAGLPAGVYWTAVWCLS